jgi:hypothetical protein
MPDKRLTSMTLGAGIREPNYDCIHQMLLKKSGSIGVVSDPIVTGTGILVDFVEQIGGFRDVDVLLR